MLVDANVLLYGVDRASRFHAASSAWLVDQLNGPRRVGFPWATLMAFMRIVTHPRASAEPLSPEQAWEHVTEWLACDAAWVPTPTERHADVFGGLVSRYQLRGNLIADAHLASLAIEHGLAIASADTDFARFTEIRWVNPVAEGL